MLGLGTSQEIRHAKPRVTAGGVRHEYVSNGQEVRRHLLAIEKTTSPRPLGQMPQRIQAEPF